MIRSRNIILLLLLLILTILYCGFIYLGMGFYKLLLESQGIKDFSNFTVVTSTRPLLWQILAFLSLAVNSFVAFFLSRKKGDPQAIAFAAACHIIWLLICSFLHAIGSLLPFVMWVYVLE